MRCSVCWRSAVLALSSSEDLCSSTARSAASPYSPASASVSVPVPLKLFISRGGGARCCQKLQATVESRTELEKSMQPDSGVDTCPRSSFEEQGVCWRVHCHGRDLPGMPALQMKRLVWQSLGHKQWGQT